MTDAPQVWQNRIVGYDVADPEQLLANPKNWRIHPKVQQDALEGVLEDVGWVDDIIVNVQTDTVLDGHLRVALALRNSIPEVPIKYVDLTEAEEDLILATFDPITAMAVADKEKLDELLQNLQVEDEGIRQAIVALAEKEGVSAPGFEPVDPLTQPWLDEKAKAICPECGHEFHLPS